MCFVIRSPLPKANSTRETRSGGQLAEGWRPSYRSNQANKQFPQSNSATIMNPPLNPNGSELLLGRCISIRSPLPKATSTRETRSGGQLAEGWRPSYRSNQANKQFPQSNSATIMNPPLNPNGSELLLGRCISIRIRTYLLTNLVYNISEYI